MSGKFNLTSKAPQSKTGNSVSQTTKTTFSHSINSSINQILFLQRTVGNRTVEKLLKSGFIQAKLTIGQPGDVYEQEADRVAEQVMQMSDPSTAGRKEVSEYDQIPRIQRVCTDCEEELHRQKNNLDLGHLKLGSSSQEELHRQPMEEEEEILQTKELSGETPGVTTNAEAQINSVRRGGQPLSESVRAFFEPRFGQDFSRVRIHTGSNAGESAKAVNALAYTIGQDVVFGGGQYSPETTEGKRLLAHELTHVMQQTRMDTGQSRFILRQPLKGMDLTAPFWSGKKEVENILDGIDKVKFGRKDNVVTIIQEALLKLGFTLPKFGADGDFGAETRRAVMDFQRSAGLTGVDVDGEVGSKTITLMDMALREGRTEKDRDDKSRDTKILNLPRMPPIINSVSIFSWAIATFPRKNLAKFLKW